jgi:hypothetical protein
MPFSLLAQSISPFDTFNQSPVIQIHGLPAIDSARVVSGDRSRYRLTTNITNNYTDKQRGNEDVLFDGETQRVTFSYTQGMGKDVEWGIRIPYVSHGGGSLDSFIEGWHDVFGLPQGGRDTAPHNQLTYRYVRNGNTLLDITNFTEGLGDLRINGAWQWSRAKMPDEASIALRTSLSLPTGDSNNLLGSGGFDAAFWVSADRVKSWFGYSGALWGGAGILLLGEGDVLANQQRDLALFGSIGGGAKVWPRVSIKVQLDIHSSLYSKSSLDQINSDSAQLIFGGELAIDKNMRLDLAIKEDPTVHASPDVVFHIGLTINN